MNAPSEYELQKSILEEMEKIRKQIRLLIGTQHFSIATDALTTKSMTMSVLGVVIFFIDNNNLKVERAALDLCALTERHTGDYIRQISLEKIKSFGLDETNVVRVVSDGASNMKKAFFEPFTSATDDDQNDEYYADMLDLDSDEIEENVTRLENEEETEDLPFNVWCACHRLQLVAKDAVDKYKPFQDLRKRVFAVISKFARSSMATTKLFAKSGHRLLFPANVRWLSVYITYERVSQISEQINSVALEQQWPVIGASDLKLIGELLQLLKPIKDLLESLEADNLTISMVYPGVEMLLKFYNVS